MSGETQRDDGIPPPLAKDVAIFEIIQSGRRGRVFESKRGKGIKEKNL